MIQDKKCDKADFMLDKLDPEQQFAMWHDIVKPFFRPSLDGDTNKTIDDFRANFQIAPIPDVLLVTCASQAQYFDRGMGDVRSSGWDHIVIQNYLSGGFKGQCGDKDVAVEAGDINIIDLNRTLRTQAPDFSNITLVLPRDRLPIAAKHDLHGCVISQRSGMAALVGTHLHSIVEHASSLSPSEATAALDALCLMLSGSDLRGADTLVRTTANASVHERICAHIDKHLEDPTLSPAGIAAACQVSRATLYRLFGFDGGVMGYIAGRRLDRAFNALRRLDNGRNTIAQVAYRSGFTNEAHFSRSFKSRFAMTPRDARRLAQEGWCPNTVIADVGPRDWVSNMRRLRDAL